MKRHKILFFMLMLCASAGAQVAHTHEHSSLDNDSTPIKEAVISEITIQGIAGTQRLQDAAPPFAIITPMQLHQTPATNIVDNISHKPGLAQISTGVGISKPVIRGLGYNRVVTVEQGIRQEGQQWGDEHGLEVDAEGVQSVEILKGPASLMYGSDAIAGVVILHPMNPIESNTMQVKVGGEYQSCNGLYDYNVGFAGNVGGLLWNWHFVDKSAHCYKNSLDGYVPGSWFKEHDIQGMLGVNRSWGHSWLRFSHVNFIPGITEGERDYATGELEWEDENLPKSYDRQLPSQKVIHTKLVSDNMWNIGSGTLKAILGYQQNYRREFEESFDDADLALKLHTVNYDLKYNLSLQNHWKMVAGIGGMWQKNVNSGKEYLIPDYHLFDIGGFLTAEKQINKLHLSGGVRIDNRSMKTTELVEEGVVRFNSIDKDFAGLTGSLGAVYNVTDKLNVRLNIARGFRAPTISELSSNGVHEGSVQYEMGNNDLSPEFSLQTDLGLDYTSDVINIQTALFLNRINNYVFLSKIGGLLTDGYATYRYLQGDARLLGGELSVDVHPINALHIENDFCFVNGIQLRQPAETHYLPKIPAPRWNCSVRYEFPDFAKKHCRQSFVSAGLEYNWRQNHFYALDGTETATPDYFLFNVSIGMDLHIFGNNCIQMTVSCMNIFDKVYQSHLSRLKYADTNIHTGRQGVSAMGRNICLKVSIPMDIHI